MKVLVMIVGHEFNNSCSNNIDILNNYLCTLPNTTIEYCGISNNDDFHNYEGIINFKYKVVNPKFQLSKVCDFINEYKESLDYDWFIKIRPDMELLEMFSFDILSDISINARARKYCGPKKIKYGMSINGPDDWRNVGDCSYDESENLVYLDDMFFIFHKNVIDLGGFDKVPDEFQNESTQSIIWRNRGINLNVIGINLKNTKYNTSSGDLN